MNTSPLTVLGVPHDALNFAMPAEACDCHTHVFGPSANYPLSPERNYMPGDALVPDLLALHDGLHIARVVIVHPSPYGSDNACTLDALRVLGPRGRGVAVIDAHTTDAQLHAMHDVGVRGIRLNLETSGIHDPDYAAQQLVQDGLATLADKHMIIGRNEIAVQHAHESVRRLMNGEPVHGPR
jgi:predicted TIM-barrel fold metal-dependent hydrolase